MGSDMADRPARETAAEDAIEVTAEMIEAGVMEFYRGDSRVEFIEDIVFSIFLAMKNARKAER